MRPLRVDPANAAGPRVLVGGVGYSFLRDFSVGPVLSGELVEESWPAGVVVEDLHYGPVAVAQRLMEESPSFDRVVVFGAVRRGRPAGTVHAYRWSGELPDEEELQARVSEAVTGVVGLDNLVLVTAALDTLPGEVAVVEVEPAVEEAGEEFSPAVAESLERIRARVREAAGTGFHRLPVEPLAGDAGETAPRRGPGSSAESETETVGEVGA